MKKIWFGLTIISTFALLALAQSTTGQKNLDAQDFMGRRQALFERVMKLALEGDRLDEIEEALREFHNDEGLFPKDLWNDQVFKDMEEKMQQDLGGFRSWSGGSGASYEWKETVNERVLEITPKDKNTPLDIQIKKGMIEISSQVKEENIKGNARSMNMSSFKQSFSAPDDVDTEKAKIENKDGKVIIKFPWRNGVSSSAGSKEKKTPIRIKKEEERVPLKAEPHDLTI